MIATTADPAGDVSQRARSGLVSAVSQNTFAAVALVWACGQCVTGGVRRTVAWIC